MSSHRDPSPFSYGLASEVGASDRKRMRAAVAEAVSAGGARLRTLSPPALVGLLAASALAPVIAAAVGAGGVLVAGVGVVGSVGANVMTDVIAGMIDRLRVERGGADPAPELVREAVAQRIATAFAGGDADTGLRGEVIALFQAVDVAGTAFQRATELEDQELLAALTQAFVELTMMFSEFTFAVVRIRLVLDELRGEVRREAARHSVEREGLRRTAADLDRTLDRLLTWERERLGTQAPHAAARPRWSGCPYLGLRPFQESDSTIFYGRQEMIDRLLARLGEQLSAPGVLLMVGPSGAGKSSLLRAGVMAGLGADRFVKGCRTWPRLVITPALDPIRLLAGHLAELAGIDAIGVERALTDHPDRANLLVEQILNRHVQLAEDDVPARLVLVVDQFEELFTQVQDHAVRQRYVDILTSMAYTADPARGAPGALVVVGIRGDFLDKATVFPLLRDAAQTGVFAVTPMNEAELRQAISGPAAEAGVQVPRELTDRIVEDLRERSLPTGFDSGALPLLSQVMFMMWPDTTAVSPAARLTVTGYERTGGVANIVNRSAEEVYTALSETERETARRVFLHLCVSSNGILTRRATPRQVLRAVTGTGRLLETVLDRFAEKRLLTFNAGGLVDVSHEELLRSWSRLHGWLRPDIADQALRRALAEDAHAWQERDHEPSYLYRGGQLLAVQTAVARWAANPAAGLTVDSAAEQFLAASRRRDRRVRRAYQTAAAVMGVMLVVLAGTAVLAQRNANRAAEQAGHAKEQHASALSRQLAAQSRTTAATSRARSEQLAAASLHVAHTEEADTAASALLVDYHSVLPQTGGASTVAFNPAGTLLATGSQDGTVQMWDPTTGRPVGEPLTGHNGAVQAVAFNPAGTLLATAARDGTVQLWDLNTRKPMGEPLTDHTRRAFAVAFNPAGTLLATAAAQDGTVRLWDPTTRKPVHKALTGHIRPVFAMAFNPAGTLLATAGGDSTVRLWDPATGKPVGEPLFGHKGSVYAVAFNPAGTLLATAGYDVRLWDPTTRKPIGKPLTGHTGFVDAVTFNPAGTLLATAGRDGTVRMWDPATRKPTGEPLTGHTGEVYAVAFNPAGTVLATAARDETVRLWDPTTRKPIGGSLTGHNGAVEAVAFNPSGTLLATAARDGTVRMWDPTTGKPISGSITRPKDPVYAMAFNPAGTLLATAGPYVTVRLWNPATGMPVGRPLTGHNSTVFAVTFNRAGTLLATGSWGDGTVRLWDPTTGKPVGKPLTGKTEPVSSPGFDGELVSWFPGLR